MIARAFALIYSCSCFMEVRTVVSTSKTESIMMSLRSSLHLHSKCNEILIQKTVSSSRWVRLVVSNRKFSTAIRMLVTHRNSDFYIHCTAHHHEALSEEVSLYIAQAMATQNGWSIGSSFFVKTMHFALRSNSDSPLPPQPLWRSPCVPGRHNAAFMFLPLPSNRCRRLRRQNNNCLYRLGRKAAAFSSLTKRGGLEL